MIKATVDGMRGDVLRLQSAPIVGSVHIRGRHADLLGRDEPDQHAISAIKGLVDTLGRLEVTVDEELSTESDNPVTNKAIAKTIDTINRSVTAIEKRLEQIVDRDVVPNRLLWSGNAAPGNVIDMRDTGWKDYTLYKVLLAANGTGIIATRVTTSSGEYFRGIGGSVGGSSTYHAITASVTATVSDDVITVVGTANENHTVNSPYHAVTSSPAIIAIYGII